MTHLLGRSAPPPKTFVHTTGHGLGGRNHGGRLWGHDNCRPTCIHCGKTDHPVDRCYAKFPHLHPQAHVRPVEPVTRSSTQSSTSTPSADTGCFFTMTDIDAIIATSKNSTAAASSSLS